MQESHSRTLLSQSCSIIVRMILKITPIIKYWLILPVSPPHLLGYANGIAQSIVSFARFVGPVLGGYVRNILSITSPLWTCTNHISQLWSVSVDGNPSGYPLGFIACSCVTLFAIAHSFLIRWGKAFLSSTCFIYDTVLSEVTALIVIHIHL